MRVIYHARQAHEGNDLAFDGICVLFRFGTVTGRKELHQMTKIDDVVSLQDERRTFIRQSTCIGGERHCPFIVRPGIVLIPLDSQLPLFNSYMVKILVHQPPCIFPPQFCSKAQPIPHPSPYPMPLSIPPPQLCLRISTLTRVRTRSLTLQRRRVELRHTGASA